MTKQLNINSLTPVSAALIELFSRAQHIRFKKKAQQFTVGSKIDSLTGATVKQQASSQVFKFTTSLTSHFGLVQLLDKSTNVLANEAHVLEEGEKPEFERADWRTIIFFAFPTDLFIPSIDGYIPGLGWTTVDLTNRRFWNPAPQSAEAINSFNQKMKQLHDLECEKKFVDSQRKKFKKTLEKDVAYTIKDENGDIWTLQCQEGSSDKIFDENGEEIKKVRSIHENKQLFLTGNFDKPHFETPSVKTVEDIVALELRFKQLSTAISRLSKEIRPIQLGLVEDYMICTCSNEITEITSKPIQYGDVTYSVSLKNDSTYDYAPEVVKKLKKGVYSIKSVVTDARWSFKIDVPYSSNVEVDEEEFTEA